MLPLCPLVRPGTGQQGKKRIRIRVRVRVRVSVGVMLVSRKFVRICTLLK
jgi:hypothetical protein